MSKTEFKSRVYTERPAYADLPTEEKFSAIQGIIITHLTRHPNAICSYSGGSDSGIAAIHDIVKFRRREYENQSYLPCA